MACHPPQAGKRNDVSDSYAKALVELADEKTVLEQVHSDVDALAALVKENKKFADLMFNPIVEADKKKAVIDSISKGAGFQKYTSNFLKLLVEKDRVNLLSEICESFEEQYCTMTDTQVRGQRRARRVARGGAGVCRVCAGCAAPGGGAAVGGAVLDRWAQW
jgi:F-type H+-transporting ATPase subunit delta